jgi:hypothetical protein
MFRNMAASMLKHETIRTTLPKAKELRRVVEPLITLAKEDSVANRRLAFDRLRDKEVVGKLFSEIGPRFKERPGGSCPGGGCRRVSTFADNYSNNEKAEQCSAFFVIYLPVQSKLPGMR